MINLHSSICQSFAFRDSLLHYIRISSTPKISEKLSKSAKVFYSLYPYDKFINDLYLDDYQNGDKNVFSLNVARCQSMEQLQVYSTKIWLRNKFDLDVVDIAMDSISNIILKCTAKIIRLTNIISKKDFKLLTESGMVESLQVEEVIDANGNPIALEEIFICVPNARKIIVSNPNISSVSMERLLLLNHNQKIHRLGFQNVNFLFSLSHYFDFIKKNAIKEANIWIMLSDDVNSKLSTKFESEFEKNLESFKKS